jgi:hypothetical protein
LDTSGIGVSGDLEPGNRFIEYRGEQEETTGEDGQCGCKRDVEVVAARVGRGEGSIEVGTSTDGVRRRRQAFAPGTREVVEGTRVA